MRAGERWRAAEGQKRGKRSAGNAKAVRRSEESGAGQGIAGIKDGKGPRINGKDELIKRFDKYAAEPKSISRITMSREEKAGKKDS